MDASTTVLRFSSKLIFYNEHCISRMRGRLARWRSKVGDCWLWLAVSINHEQRQVVCVFRKVIVSNSRTYGKLVKRRGCNFRSLHSAVATVQINRWQASTDADNLCVGFLLCHSSSTREYRYAVRSRVLEERRCRTHKHQTLLFEPVKSDHIHSSPLKCTGSY